MTKTDKQNHHNKCSFVCVSAKNIGELKLNDSLMPPPSWLVTNKSSICCVLVLVYAGSSSRDGSRLISISFQPWTYLWSAEMQISDIISWKLDH